MSLLVNEILDMDNDQPMPGATPEANPMPEAPVAPAEGAPEMPSTEETPEGSEGSTM